MDRLTNQALVVQGERVDPRDLESYQDAPIQQPIRGDKKILSNPSTDQKRVRRLKSRTAADQGDTVSTPERVAFLRSKVASGTPTEAAVAAAEIEEIAARGRQGHVASREWAADLTSIHGLHPTVVKTAYTHASGETDWIDGLASVDTTGMDSEMRAQASLFFAGKSEAVKADPGEFFEQALGTARVHAGRYAERSAEAERSFMETCSALLTRHLALTEGTPAPVTPQPDDKAGLGSGLDQPPAQGFTVENPAEDVDVPPVPSGAADTRGMTQPYTAAMVMQLAAASRARHGRLSVSADADSDYDEGYALAVAGGQEPVDKSDDFMEGFYDGLDDLGDVHPAPGVVSRKNASNQSGGTLEPSRITPTWGRTAGARHETVASRRVAASDFFNEASTVLDNDHKPVGDEDCDICGYGCDGEVRKHNTGASPSEARSWVHGHKSASRKHADGNAATDTDTKGWASQPQSAEVQPGFGYEQPQSETEGTEADAEEPDSPDVLPHPTASSYASRFTAGDLSDLPQAMQDKAKEKSDDSGSDSSDDDDSTKDDSDLPDFLKDKKTSTVKTAGDVVDDIVRYEDGEMGTTEMVAFFQGLIDSGMAWKLQGHYGRVAQSLIDQGLCHPAVTASKTALPEGQPSPVDNSDDKAGIGTTLPAVPQAEGDEDENPTASEDPTPSVPSGAADVKDAPKPYTAAQRAFRARVQASLAQFAQ